MSPITLVIAGLLLLGVLAVLLQAVWRPRFRPLPALLRLLGTLLCAGLLWSALFPRSRPLDGVALVLLTADADPAIAAARQQAGAMVLALPEAAALDTIRRVPDLATALRQTPQAHSLELLGRGLPVRDRDTPIALPTTFVAPPELPGLLHWDAASAVPAGASWTVSGEVTGQAANATLALVDPAGAVVASATPAADGRFSLATAARSPGRMLYRLQLRAADRQPLESIELPLQVVAGHPAKVLLLAGAPSPELKYLRRWAVDAGLALSSRMALGQSMQIGVASPQATPQGWREFDLVLLDERSLATLSEAGRKELEAAVRAGTGLLLRLTAPLGSAERSWLQQLDLDLQQAPRPSQFPWPAEASDNQAPPLLLGRRPLQANGRSHLPLLRSPGGDTLGVWRPLGAGRLGVVWLTDSFRLQLAGQGAQHAGLWQQVFNTLARPVPVPADAPQIHLQSSQPLRMGQRAVWCGMDPARRYTLRDAQAEQRLQIDPAQPGCAAGWPTQPGWLELRDGDTVAQVAYVYPADAAPAQAARQIAEATLAIAQQSPAKAPETTATQPGPAWPWWLAWLAASCLLWWFERRGWRQG